MKILGWVRTIAHELLGLFVDDWPFTLALLAWLLVFRVLVQYSSAHARWAGLILFLGFALVLAVSARSSASRR